MFKVWESVRNNFFIFCKGYGIQCTFKVEKIIIFSRIDFLAVYHQHNRPFMGDAAGMEGSSLAKIFVGGLDRSVDEVRLSKIRISPRFFSIFVFALALKLAILWV